MRLAPGDAPLARHLAVATAALLPLATWWLRSDPTGLTRILDPCALRALTGFPCPTCGGTRAMLALSRFDLPAAAAANPLVTLGGVGLVIWAVGGVVTSLAPRLRRRIEASPGDGRRLAWTALGLVVANWAWLLVR